VSEDVAAVSKSEYRFDLGVFEGPLDLLLYLIRKEEVDLHDISLSKVTRQYLQYLEMMQTLNLEIAGEYILMAATLIRIKARLLLPRDDNDDEEIDPREELIMALVEYKKYKEAGEILREKATIEERNAVPPSPVGQMELKVDLSPSTTLFDLVSAFAEVLSAKRDETHHDVDLEEASIEERTEHIARMLKENESATFSELFADIPRKIVAVVTFIALLEMVRARRISIMQSKPFAQLRVYRGDRFNAHRDAIDLIGNEAPDEPEEE
jgi:segregation and condensation protein A